MFSSPSYPVLFNYRGVPPQTAEELVFAGAYAQPEDALCPQFVAMAVQMTGQADGPQVFIQFKPGAERGFVDVEEPIGQERLDRLRALAPFFLEEYFQDYGQLNSMKASHKCLYVAKSMKTGSLLGLSLSRLLPLVGIDGFVEDGRAGRLLHLLNPEVIQSFQTTMKGAKPSLNDFDRVSSDSPEEDLPFNVAALSSGEWEAGPDLAKGTSNFVIPYKRKGSDTYAFIAKQAKTSAGTLEEFTTFWGAEALGASVPRKRRLIAWRDGEPAVLSSYVGAVDYDAYMNQTTLSPVERFRLEQRMEAEQIRFAILGHLDCHKGNFRLSRAQQPFCVDMGGALRRTTAGLPKSFYWDNVPSPAFFMESFIDTDRGYLNARRAYAVALGAERRWSRVGDCLKKAAEAIERAGFNRRDFTFDVLRQQVGRKAYARLNVVSDVLEKQAALASFSYRPRPFTSGGVPEQALAFGS